MNPDEVFVTWLTANTTGVRVVTETGLTLAQDCPLIRVTGISGPETFTMRHPVIDVEYFATGADRAACRTAAMDLAENTHRLITRSMGGSVGDSVVTSVHTVGSPAWRDYGDPQVGRYVARYAPSITTH